MMRDGRGLGVHDVVFSRIFVIWKLWVRMFLESGVGWGCAGHVNEAFERLERLRLRSAGVVLSLGLCSA